MSFLTGEVGVKCREHWTTSWRRVSVWGEDIKKGLGVSPEDADLKKSQDRLQKLLPLGIEGGHAVRLLMRTHTGLDLFCQPDVRGYEYKWDMSLMAGC